MFTYLLFAHALTSSIKLVGKKMQNGRREKCFSSSFSSYRMLSHIKIKTSALHEIRAYLLHLNYSWSITFNDFRLEEQNLFFSVYWTQWRHVVWHVLSPELRVIMFITAVTYLKRFRMVLSNVITNTLESHCL